MPYFAYMSMHRKFINFDLYLQLILLLLMVVCGAAFLFGSREILLGYLCLQFVIGCWQVLSGLLLAINGSIARAYYLASVVLYFIILAIAVSVFRTLNWNSGMNFWMVLSIIMIPLAFAIWYFERTYRDFVRLKEKNDTGKELDDILDHDLITPNQSRYD